MSDDPAFGAGHNAPPPPRETAVADIRERLERYRERVEDLRKSIASYAVIRDRVDAGEVADLLGFAKSTLELISADQRAAAAPYDEAVSAVRAQVERFVAELVNVAASLRDRADEWAKEEAERIRAQEAEQAAHEQRLRDQLKPVVEPGPPPPVRSDVATPRQPKRRTVTGDYGASFTIGDDWSVEIEDPLKLPAWVFDAEKVKEAIHKLVLPMVRQGVTVPGIKSTKTLKTTARRA